jgi:hypothetical protein
MVDGNDPYDFLELQYFPVEGFSYDRTANIEARQVAGRNLESLHITGGSKSLPLRLSFTPETSNRVDMQRKIRWLESLTYNEGPKSTAPVVILKLGGIVEEGRWVVSSVKPSQSIFTRMNFGGLDPNLAYVDVVFMRWAEYNVKRSDILAGTSFFDLNPDASAPYVSSNELSTGSAANKYIDATVQNTNVRTGQYIPKAEDDTAPNTDARKEWQKKTAREQYVTNRQEIIAVGIELFKAINVLSKSVK